MQSFPELPQGDYVSGFFPPRKLMLVEKIVQEISFCADKTSKTKFQGDLWVPKIRLRKVLFVGNTHEENACIKFNGEEFECFSRI
jgi:hypothetical protein